MNRCPTCRSPLREAAKFCGHCGAAITAFPLASAPVSRQSPGRDEPSPLPPVKPLTEASSPLEKALVELATAADRTASISPLLRLAIRAAAEGPETESCLAVIGESRRGKTTVINGLLGGNLLPTTRAGTPQVIRLRFAEQWTGLPREAKVPSLPPAFLPETTENGAVFAGPLPVLRSWTILDTPGLNSLSPELESWALKVALAADHILFCVDARQLLSLREQETITKDLLPLTSCPLTLVVTHFDLVDSPEDIAELKERALEFVNGIASERVSIFMPGLEGVKVSDLRAVLEKESDGAQTASSRRPWLERVDKLLGMLEELAEPASEDASSDQEEKERQEWLVRILRREHALAKDEACGHLRRAVGQLKLESATLLRPMAKEAVWREGRARLEGRLSAAGRQAASEYLRSFHDGITSNCPPELAEVADQLDPKVNLNLRGDRRAPLPIRPRKTAKKRDWRSASLAGASLALVAFGGGWIRLVGSAVALIAAESWRRDRQKTTDTHDRGEAISILQEWLSSAEQSLVEKLSETVDQIAQQMEEALRARAVALPAPPTDERRETSLQIARCRECLAREMEATANL